MEVKNIKEIIQIFEKSSLSFLEFDDGNSHIKIKREITTSVANTPKIQVLENVSEPVLDDYINVKSPVVGVFYSAPSPDNEPFVKEGDKVSKGQVVALIEAMKVMSEIKAPADGVIAKIIAKNEQMVAFDDILMQIED
ncbi:MAG: biotin/lipoyl-containing protein [Clostridia bacterium]